MKISSEPRELKSPYVLGENTSKTLYLRQNTTRVDKCRYDLPLDKLFPRHTFHHKRNRTNPRHCKWKYISLWYFPYSSVLNMSVWC